LRDDSDGMPELVRVLERNGHALGLVRITIGRDVRDLELPLTAATRAGFVRVLNVQPFDQMPGQPYRYFFARSIRRLESGDAAEVGIRVEAGRDAKNFDVIVPLEFAKNLVWLSELKDWSEVAQFHSEGAGYARTLR
jgi:hypothetical protein